MEWILVVLLGVKIVSEEATWYTERGSIWRKLEDKRLKMIINGHVTTMIRNRRITKKDERPFEFEHQLPRGNPNIQPSLPEEYIK